MEEHNDDDAEDDCRNGLDNADDDDGAGELLHGNQDDEKLKPKLPFDTSKYFKFLKFKKSYFN